MPRSHAAVMLTLSEVFGVAVPAMHVPVGTMDRHALVCALEEHAFRASTTAIAVKVSRGREAVLATPMTRTGIGLLPLVLIASMATGALGVFPCAQRTLQRERFAAATACVLVACKAAALAPATKMPRKAIGMGLCARSAASASTAQLARVSALAVSPSLHFAMAKGTVATGSTAPVSAPAVPGTSEQTAP